MKNEIQVNVMFYHAQNLTLKIGNTEMDYACFGTGKKPLVMIPGLNLRGVKGAAVSLALMYRMFAKDYRVYIFDRKTVIPEGYTVEDIAEDTATAMKMLGLANADVFGVSQGGMIAQYLAINHPELVHKLVLGVTLSRTNATVTNVINGWVRMSGNREYDALITDMLSNMYSEAYLKKYRWLLPIMSRISKPKDFSRFIILAKACLTCDTYDKLNLIQCPVLVLGGKQDKIVTGKASEEIAEKLGCEVHMYDDLGHSAYEEAKDFNSRILAFFK